MYYIKRHKLIRTALIVITLFCLLFLRQFIMFIYPFLIGLIFVAFNLKTTIYQFLFILFLLVVTLSSAIIDGFLNENYLLSIYLILPTFLLLTSKVKDIRVALNGHLFNRVFNYFTIVLAIVNVNF